MIAHTAVVLAACVGSSFGQAIVNNQFRVVGNTYVLAIPPTASSWLKCYHRGVSAQQMFLSTAEKVVVMQVLNSPQEICAAHQYLQRQDGA